MTSESLATLSLAEVLDAAAALGLDCLEFGTGARSAAPHVDVDALLGSVLARREFLAQLVDRGLTISALNCSGNPLHPGAGGREHDAVTRKTIALAPLLGVERVVLMSGLPAAPGDARPPETTELLEDQWNDVVVPYWHELVALATEHGVRKLCIEMHGHQLVSNVPSLLRLREAVGPVVGANYDPSHLMWMGADPVAAIDALGGAIYHVHAKDMRLEAERTWNSVTLGHGHDDEFWRAFGAALERVGYDDVLSIEHEDAALDPYDGVRRSVELLRRVAPAPRDRAAASAARNGVHGWD